MDPFHNFPPYYPNIHSNIILHLRLGLPSCLFPSVFPTDILYEFLISPMRATCPAHLILRDSITVIRLSEVYKL